MNDSEWRMLFRLWWLYRLLALIPGLWWGATICYLVASDGQFRGGPSVVWSDIFIGLGFLAGAGLVFVPVRGIRKLGYIYNTAVCTLSIPLAFIIIKYHHLRGRDVIAVILATCTATVLWWPAFREFHLELKLIAGLSKRPAAAAEEELDTAPGWDQGNNPDQRPD